MNGPGFSGSPDGIYVHPLIIDAIAEFLQINDVIGWFISGSDIARAVVNFCFIGPMFSLSRAIRLRLYDIS
jgi:hypothetical protein